MVGVRPIRAGMAIGDTGFGRPYDAAGTGRVTKGWGVSGVGPTSGIQSAGRVLVDRSRSAYRNNPWIASGIDGLVGNEIGTGISIRSRSADAGFAADLQSVYAEWTSECDADGILSFNGLLNQSSLARYVAGECFIRMIRVRKRSDVVVPLRLQILESEFCPIDLIRMEPAGSKTKNGIELDRFGRRINYWMYQSHPDEWNDPSPPDAIPIRIPAGDIIHHYRPTRAGQLRGEPWTTQALVKSFVFEEYSHAELQRKKTRANHTGFITKKMPEMETDRLFDPLTGKRLDGSEAQPIVTIEPGTMISLDYGEEVTLMDSDDPGTGNSDFLRWQCMAIASGLHVPYEFMTGDYSKVNDRILRVILNEYHRFIQSNQEQLVIHQVCRRIWQAFCDTVVLAGIIDAPSDYFERRSQYVRAAYRPQAWQYLNPLQDAQSVKEWLSMGLTSREREAANRGIDVEDLDSENARDAERERANGLEYDHGHPFRMIE